MLQTLTALMQSRKFLATLITISAVAASTVLVETGKIASTSFLALVTSVTTLGAAFIGGTALEDSAQKSARARAIASATLDTVPLEPVLDATKDGAK